MIPDSPLQSLDLCSSITHIVRLISVAMGTLADSIWPHPQPEGDVFLVLNNRRTMTSACYHGNIPSLQTPPL